MLGRCLVSACRRENLDIIVIVLGAGTKSQRTNDSINLINYVYKNFEMYDFTEFVDNTFKNFIASSSSNITIHKTLKKPEFELSKINFLLPIQKTNIDNFKSSIYTLNYIDSPISKDFKIGVLQVYVNNVPILSVDIITKNTVSKTNTLKYFVYILKSITKNRQNY